MNTITEEEIAVLNAARRVLENRSRQLSENPSEARVNAAAEIAETAIFRFLNWTNAYLHAELTREQLHNREEVAS